MCVCVVPTCHQRVVDQARAVVQQVVALGSRVLHAVRDTLALKLRRKCTHTEAQLIISIASKIVACGLSGKSVPSVYAYVCGIHVLSLAQVRDQ